MVAPGSYLVKKSRVGHDGQSSEVAGILIRNHDFAMHTYACDNSRMATRARSGPAAVDVAIIGAGPSGWRARSRPSASTSAPECSTRARWSTRLSATRCGWSSSRPLNLIEIGGYPFPVQGYKPTREEAIEDYRGVAAREKIDLRLTSASNGSMVRPASSP